MAEQHDEILFQNEEMLLRNQQLIAILIGDLNTLLFYHFAFLLLISMSISFILYYIQKVDEKIDDNVMVADGHYVKA